MKRIIIFSLIFICAIICSCDEENAHREKMYYSYEYAQEFVDTELSKSAVQIDGHDYWFFECGARRQRNYCFQLEHRLDCKACLDMFD